MKSILVLTDFSEAALHAARYACVFADIFKSKQMILFHALQDIPAVSNEPIVSVGREEWFEESKRKMEDFQKTVKQFIPATTEVSFSVEEIDLVKGVEALGRGKQIDLIVMGITGKTSLEKVLIGSNTIRIMRDVRRPLLIVPRNTPVDKPKKILLASDLREVEEKTNVPALIEVLDTLEAELLVLNVTEKEQDVPKLKKEITALHETLDKYQPEVHYLSDPDIVTTIESFAASNRVGLLVTLRERHSGLSSLFRKSVSKKIVWHIRIPLLVLPV